MRKLLIALMIGLMAVAACKTKKGSAYLSEIDKQRQEDSLRIMADMEAAMMDADTSAPYDDTYNDEYNNGDYNEDAPAEEAQLPYRPSRTRTIDIIHTKLEVKFDYQNQHMMGKAYITLKPYFYPTDVVELDAKGFDMLGVFKVDAKNNTTPLEYEYKDLKKLVIKLGKKYTATEEITIFVNYVAKPNELPSEGVDFQKSEDAAIKQDKGLYFINPTGEDKKKPRQIWTQGETEASSCWFPTFDSPNERMTQEIIMTVDTQDVTLSNGKLIASKVNRDGTRTDHWKQNLPHAPYLAMMAVGQFSIVKDKWRNLEVNYYVEKEYAKHARMIFGNTPKMMEFFSKKLGVDYPWEKYHQIVVRDFVSGAMENTGAVVHFEQLQHDARMHIDQPLEDVVSHELFHHWFGDLVTIESWANTPLNESFATYGEYLWREYAYGRDEADEHIQEDLTKYLSESEDKKVNMIRFNHEKPDDMFDAHSYQKGGRILHMLRMYVGDDAFFKALNVYLTRHKFQSVEMHQLRIAFEEVTGEDLNWFFNQWFYSAGHPVLNVEHIYDEEAGLYAINVEQTQYGIGTPEVYKLPIKVDIYHANGTKTTENIMIDERYKHLEFFVEGKPLWVNFDADKALLCEKSEMKEDNQWVNQLNNGPLFMDRMEALGKATNIDDTEVTLNMIRTGMSDRFWAIRLKALEVIKENDLLESSGLGNKIASMAENDKKSSVRAIALRIIAKEKNEAYLPVFKKLIKDSSYYVAGEALISLAAMDSITAVQFAEANYPTETFGQMKAVYLLVMGKYGTGDYMQVFEKELADAESDMLFIVASGLGAHLLNGDEDRVIKGLALLDKVSAASASENWLMMFVMYGVKRDINKKYKPTYDVLFEKEANGTISAAEQAQLNKIKEVFELTGGLEEDEEDTEEGESEE